MHDSSLDIFVRRARRHWTAWVIAEHAGIGLLCGCGVAILLLPVLLYRGDDARLLAIILPLIGLLAGVVLGVRRRPSSLSAALLADERLEMADLLGTAWLARSSTDSWNATVRAMAEARCQGLSPVELIPHRLGSRAWAGIVLAAGTVLTLGLMSGTSSTTRAQSNPVPQITSSATEWWQEPKLYTSATFPQLNVPREARAESTPDSRQLPGSDEQQTTNDPTAHAAAGSSNHTESPSDGSGGGGSARTSSSPNHDAGIVSSTKAGSTAVGSLSAGGIGSASNQPSHTGQATAGQVAPNDLSSAPPWTSPNWPAERDAAMEAVRTARVPDAYRDLVRDYFEQK